MPKFSVLILWTVLLWGGIARLGALAAESPPRNAYLIWNTQDAELLPQSSVISLQQTRDGYLWVGTMKGLVRFDGLHPEVFYEADTIVDLFEDRRGNLWVGTEKSGVRVIHDGVVKEMEFEGGPAWLVSAAEDASGAVWLYAKDGRLARVLNGRLENTWPLDLGRSGCRAVVADESGQIWIGTDTRLYRVVSDLRTKEFDLRLQPVPVPGKQDFLWARKAGGFWQFAADRIWICDTNGAGREFASYAWNQGQTPITSVNEDALGNLFVGTLGSGVYCFDAAGAVTRIGGEQGLNHETILSVTMDREGSLWVGTDGGGLSRVRRSLFEIHPDTIDKTVQSVSEDAAGGLWIGLNGDAVNMDSLRYSIGGEGKKFGPGQGLLNPYVRAVLVDQHQTVWVGGIGLGGGGIYRGTNGVFHLVPGTELVQVSAMLEDRTGRIWAGGKEGLACWDGRTWRSFSVRDGLTANSIRALAEDVMGNIWIGTDGGGLNCWRGEKFEAHRMREGGLPSDFVTALLAGADGDLWVGTSGGGLAQWHEGQWSVFSKRDGLAGNNITYLSGGEPGFLWVGSNEGLMRVNKSALQLFTKNRLNSLPVRTFGKADGLPTKECSSGSQPAVAQTQAGKLWFPTTKGLVGIQPGKLILNTNPPPVVIEAVFVDGESQSTNTLQTTWARDIIMAADKEVLEIHFTSLNLASPERARFQYRLDDGEEKWIETRGMREARFTKLPHGRYRFEVRACNEDGVWSPTPAVLGIVVEPPYWKTWWFQTLIAAVLLGIVVGTVYFISTQKLQRQVALLRQQEALEKERARIARDLHDQLGANLTQVGLLGEMVGEDKNLPEEVASHAQQICQTARTTSDALDEIVWAANPSNDTLEGLINYACKYAQDYLALADLRYRLDVPTELPEANIPPDLRHNVFLAFKESVNNVVKHARATEVKIRLRLESNKFIIEIEDNGRGPAEAATKTGRNGLRNMRKRMEDVGGMFEMSPGAECGTIVRLTSPITRR